MPSLILAWALLYPGGCIPIYIRAESLNSEVKRACEIELVPAQHESCFCTIGPGQQLNISSTMVLSFSWGNCLKMLSALVRRLMFSGLQDASRTCWGCAPCEQSSASSTSGSPPPLFAGNLYLTFWVSFLQSIQGGQGISREVNLCFTYVLYFIVLHMFMYNKLTKSG